MTQIKYYGEDTGIPISQKHVRRVKENNGRYSAVVMDMHSLTVERSDWCASIQDLNNFMHKCIIAMETDKDHIHFLINYDTTDRVCDIVKLIKQQTTYYLWQKYPNFLSKCYWKHKIFWSDGYFACSIGEVSSATIQKYIESQG